MRGYTHTQIYIVLDIKLPHQEPDVMRTLHRNHMMFWRGCNKEKWIDKKKKDELDQLNILPKYLTW